ncbi:MAG: hypothetical protein NTW74_07150 [Acidobacteria bacterium]|nr:hypothetical protein [Acidobacteriota bacterium]
MVYLFGFLSEDIDLLAVELSKVLRISLEPYEAGSRGGEYCRGQGDEESLILQHNRDVGVFPELAEEDFPKYRLLLYVETLQDQRSVLRWFEQSKLEASLLRVSKY